MSTIASRIKQAREAARLSQQEVASHLGLSRNSVAQWEIGANRPAHDRLAKLAGFLGVTVQWLLLGEGESGVKASVAPEEDADRKDKARDLIRTIRTLVLELDDLTR